MGDSLLFETLFKRDHVDVLGYVLVSFFGRTRFETFSFRLSEDDLAKRISVISLDLLTRFLDRDHTTKHG